jgi:hypothetical protein
VGEYRPAIGSESSYWQAGTSAFWDIQIGKPAWNLKLSQEFALTQSRYYQSSTNRRDWNYNLSESLTKNWNERWESKIQIGATFNKSNVKASYQYDRFQATLSTSATF